MDTTIRLRIGRALGELAEIEDRRAAHFGFGVFTTVDHAHRGGSALAVNQICSRKSGDLIRLQPAPWVVPSPTGECHIRWWGNRAGIHAFEPWVVRFVNLLSRLPDDREHRRTKSKEHPTLTVVATASEPVFQPARHSHDALLTLVRFAAGQESLKPSVEVVIVEEGCFYEVKPFAIRFVRAVAEHVSTGPTARLVVNVESNAVTFEGRTTFPDVSWVRVLSLLQEAKGQPLSRSAMQEADKVRHPSHSVLDMEERLDRTVLKAIRDKLGIPVLSSKKGYYLPPECLPEE